MGLPTTIPAIKIVMDSPEIMPRDPGSTFDWIRMFDIVLKQAANAPMGISSTANAQGDGISDATHSKRPVANAVPTTILMEETLWRAAANAPTIDPTATNAVNQPKYSAPR